MKTVATTHRPRFWYCIIGPIPDGDVPEMGDGPPRSAAREAVHKMTGHWSTCSSGWLEQSEAEAAQKAMREDYCRQRGIKST
ncbi:MAG: hypothetical protein WC763_07255 [Candidatus Paceibacterota bacterium]